MLINTRNDNIRVGQNITTKTGTVQYNNNSMINEHIEKQVENARSQNYRAQAKVKYVK